MQIKKFALLNLLAGMVALTSCGQGQKVYRYAETSVYFDDIRILKTVYKPGCMKLYYSGEDLSYLPVRCYDDKFLDLGSDFEYSFKKGVLIVKADFAERISGLRMGDGADGIVYHLRYLDSEQFAWMVDELWLDAGWSEVGDAETYYTEEERTEGRQEHDIRAN